MAMLTYQFRGGQEMRVNLGALQSELGSARRLRVGFLENATYPPGDNGTRLRRAVNRLTPAIEAAHPSWRPRLTAWAAWATTHHPRRYVAQVAFWNEFGTRHMPPRPFFRHAITAHARQWGPALLGFLQAAEGRRDQAAQALRQLGLLIRGQIVQSILNTTTPANAPLTLFIKNFQNAAPLRDTAVMMRSVDFEVS